MSDNIHSCDNCLQQCKGLRCTGCGRTIYCSRKCQKSHWKLVHKDTCSKELKKQNGKLSGDDDVKKFASVTMELHHEVSKTSFKKAEEHLYRAKDKIAGIEEAEKHTCRINALKKMYPQSKKVTMESNDASPYDRDSYHSLSKDDSCYASIHYVADHWRAQLEELRHIRCFHIVLIPSTKSIQTKHIELIQDEGKKRISVSSEENNRSVILFTAFIPRQIMFDEVRIKITDSSCFSLTIPYSDNYEDTESYTEVTLSSPEAVASLKCRNCKSSFFPFADDTNTHVIHKVLPLPTGYWGEISDYIMCNNENPALFSITAAKGFAFEDSAILLLHEADFLADSLKVVPSAGYGEDEEISQQQMENSSGSASSRYQNDTTKSSDRFSLKTGAEYRGERQWQCDEYGGATVCCSSCGKILGYTSIQPDCSLRLYKHLLLTNEDKFVDRKGLTTHTCGSFIARELVRYAESQAVYTFVVSVRGIENFGQTLFLHLVSWDTRIARHCGNSVNELSINFRKCLDAVKVIYEERISIEESGTSSSVTDLSNLMSWTWGGRSFCCPPGQKEIHKKTNKSSKEIEASVRIYITIDEWMDLNRELKNGSLFVLQSVSDATVRLKLGNGRSTQQAKLSLLKPI